MDETCIYETCIEIEETCTDGDDIIVTSTACPTTPRFVVNGGSGRCRAGQNNTIQLIGSCCSFVNGWQINGPGTASIISTGMLTATFTVDVGGIYTGGGYCCE